MKRVISFILSVAMVFSIYTIGSAEGTQEESLSVEVISAAETEIINAETPNDNVIVDINDTEAVEENTEIVSIEEFPEVIEQQISNEEIVNDSWASAFSLSTGKAKFDTAVINGALYIIGGHDSTGCVNSIEKYNDSISAWNTVTTIPTATNGYSVTQSDTKIYIIGGYSNNTYLNTVQVYDTVSNTWSTTSPMLERREEAASLYADNKIYVFGGRNANGIVNSYEYYDLTEETWNKVTTGYAESIIRVGAKAKYIDGFVCIYGGMNKNYANMGVNVYSASNLNTSVASCAANKEHITIAWGADKGMIFSAPARSSTYTVNELVVENGSAYINTVNSITAPSNLLYVENVIYGGYLYCMGGYNSVSKTYGSDNYVYSVYYGDYALSNGDISSIVTSSGNTITLNVDTGKDYVFFFNVNNMSTFSGYTFNIDFPEDSFTLRDGCAITPDWDTNLRQINGTDITLTRKTSSGVSFTCGEQIPSGKKISKTVNAVILRAQSSGQRTISYSMTR